MIDKMYADARVAEIHAEVRQIHLARSAREATTRDARRLPVLPAAARFLGRTLRRAGNGIESWGGNLAPASD